jgi:hypothetical protein
MTYESPDAILVVTEPHAEPYETLAERRLATLIRIMVHTDRFHGGVCYGRRDLGLWDDDEWREELLPVSSPNSTSWVRCLWEGDVPRLELLQGMPAASDSSGQR